MSTLDPETTVVLANEPGRIYGVMNNISPRLPPELRRPFGRILAYYFVNFGDQGLYDRVNNRTVSQIIAEYAPSNTREVMAAGEVEGVKFTLYGSPGQVPRENS